jgi:DNA-binding MarR family transcriptional regulator
MTGDPRDVDDLLTDVHALIATLMVEARTHLAKDGALTLQQRSILDRLATQGPMRLADLARHEGVRAPTMGARIGRLVRMEMVERSADVDSDRIVLIALTPNGRRARHDAHNDRLAEILSTLNVTEIKRLHRGLSPLRSRLELDSRAT